MKTKFRFKVKAGRHVQGKRTYKEGEVVHSNSHLHRIFPNKFIKLGREVDTIQDEEQLEDDEESTVSDFGTDVSDKFDTKDSGLLVFKKGSNYTVVDPSEPGKALNEHKLKRAAVDAFISETLSD